MSFKKLYGLRNEPPGRAFGLQVLVRSRGGPHKKPRRTQPPSPASGLFFCG
jgi:hypothetical protein